MPETGSSTPQPSQAVVTSNGKEGGRAAAALRELKLPRAISVQRLAELIHASPIDVIKQLMRAGIMANINQNVDYDTAAKVAAVFGLRATPQAEAPRETSLLKVEEEDVSLLQPRPPVVTILGHVDHGKTTLLDAIRKTNVAGGEAGGITQHIGAYQVEYRDHKITFLDTPGHEAFTAMRARGAEVTDVGVLVVAANDGIMPQTVEAIHHVQAAKVPIVVAINKMDLPEADPERVKRQLADHGLLIEEWGGEVIAVPVSAKTRTGLEDLLENILVLAEVSDLKANPRRPAAGVVIEARLDKSRGPVATLLVNRGTLKVGDYVVAGTIRGRVKALVNDVGRRIKEAPPSTPAEVLGLNELPQVGDTFLVVASEQAGRALAEERQRQQKTARRVTLEEMFTRIRTGEAKELNLILKADVEGSVEAIRDALNRLSSDKAQLRVIHAASGTITQSDVFLAVASQAIVLGFNTSVEPGARQVAEAEHVEVRLYSIIYQLLEDIQNTLQGLIQPTVVETVEGRAVVRAIFPRRGGQSKVAGVYVTEGRMSRSAQVRVMRQGKLIHDGPMASLRHFQENVREVAAGAECGVVLAGYEDFQEGDTLEAYHQERPGR